MIATPTLAGDVLIVPTHYDDLVALDTADADELWRLPSSESLLHDTSTRTSTSSYPSSAVVAGDTLWVIGGDGVLRAIVPGRGDILWEAGLGVPGNGGLAAAGEVLVVATYDGTLRAMVSDPCIGEHVPQPDRGGCGCRAAGSGDWLGLAVLVLGLGLVLGRVRRRAR